MSKCATERTAVRPTECISIPAAHKSALCAADSATFKSSVIAADSTAIHTAVYYSLVNSFWSTLKSTFFSPIGSADMSSI